ncbi:MAG: hypothetical protein H6Q74_1453 [Firmicutes bacterium]|nr:hypothetical protein [Bacillota bacterium]
MQTITLNNTIIAYTLKYSSRRKTLQLKVVPPGLIQITLPSNFPLNQIEDVLKAKAAWIISHLKQLATLADCHINSTLTNGAQILYLGEAMTLNIIPISITRPSLTLNGQTITIYLPIAQFNQPEVLFNTLRQWYINAATEYLAVRTNYWAEKISVRPRHISIRQQKTRWGSASPSGNINYNWQIIMAPPEVIDYLIIHELCHIKIFNHSATYWQLVAQSDANYKQHREWLRHNGYLLTRLF